MENIPGTGQETRTPDGWKDRVECYNCRFRGLVERGAETCPECGESGMLAWIAGYGQSNGG